MAFRPKTLIAAVVPIVSAAALAFAMQDQLPLNLFFNAIFCALSLQIATNLFNDLIDFKKGADNPSRLGPTRVTQSGLMSEKQVLVAALFFCGIAIVTGLPLLISGGWPFLVLGLASLFLAYGYTGGPFPLAYLGIGDIFVIAFFGLVAVGGSYFLFTGDINLPSMILGLQLGALATVLLAINNLRDSGTDVQVGKKTLAVRFGDRFVKSEIIFLLTTAYGLIFFWWYHFDKPIFALVFLSLPLALKIGVSVWNNTNKSALNTLLGLSGLLLFVFSILFCLAVLI